MDIHKVMYIFLLILLFPTSVHALNISTYIAAGIGSFLIVFMVSMIVYEVFFNRSCCLIYDREQRDQSERTENGEADRDTVQGRDEPNEEYGFPFEECSICYETLDPQRGTIADLKCNHEFHRECIFHWFNATPSFTCPYCRQQPDLPINLQRYNPITGTLDMSEYPQLSVPTSTD